MHSNSSAHSESNPELDDRRPNRKLACAFRRSHRGLIMVLPRRDVALEKLQRGRLNRPAAKHAG